MNKGTLNQLFFTTIDRHAGLPAAFRSKVGGAWVAITHRETLERVQAISLGLRELGIQPGDKVSLVSENRPEWALADYACLTARTTDVPIYPTLPAQRGNIPNRHEHAYKRRGALNLWLFGKFCGE